MNASASQTVPDLTFTEPKDAASLPPSKGPLLVSASAFGGLCLAIVVGALLNQPVVLFAGGGIGLLTFLVTLFIGGKRLVDRKLVEFVSSLADANIRIASELKKDQKTELFSAVAHLDKWLRYGARGLTSYAETTIETDRGPIDVRLFHHRYTVSTGKSTQVIQHWVALAPAPTGWPTLTLTNEQFFSKIAKRFGAQDHQLDDASFNERWMVKCDDADFALVALPPELQGFLAESPKNEAWVMGSGSVAVLQVGIHRADAVIKLADRVARARTLMPPELDAGWTTNT